MENCHLEDMVGWGAWSRHEQYNLFLPFSYFRYSTRKCGAKVLRPTRRHRRCPGRLAHSGARENTPTAHHTNTTCSICSRIQIQLKTQIQTTVNTSTDTLNTQANCQKAAYLPNMQVKEAEANTTKST